jgi:DNA-binding transcriptional LysR family regulator
MYWQAGASFPFVVAGALSRGATFCSRSPPVAWLIAARGRKVSYQAPQCSPNAMMPALIAGSGLGILPEFILRDALATSLLERLLPDWSIPLGAVYWLTPPAGPRPKRVEVLGDFLVEKLAGHAKR